MAAAAAASAILPGMQMVSEASQEQLYRMSKYASEEARALLNGADMIVMRVLTELVPPDLEAHDPGPVAGDEGTATIMFVPERPQGILDVEVSGSYTEPVVKIELLPVGDTPLTATMVERWAAGEQGERPRRVEWAFQWDTGQTRRIVYDVERNGDGADYASNARRRTALKLAELAGWPLPQS